MKKNLYMLIVAAATLLGGCGEPDPIYIHNPHPGNSEATLSFTSAESTNIDAAKQDVIFDFVSSQVNFEVKTDRSWCSAKVVGNNKLVVSVDKNDYANNRVATITVVAGIYDNITAPKSVTIYQGPGETALPKVGDIYGTGIVYWVSTAAADAGFRTVSLKRVYGMDAQWSTDLYQLGLTDKNDGRKNVAKLDQNYMSEYPAFNFCAKMAPNHGQGWYLPALNEWNDIFLLYNGGITPTKGLPTEAEQVKRAEFEAFLAANGGDPFNSFVASSNGDSYWTSTEVDFENAYTVLTWNHKTLEGSKTGSKRGARCIQHFDLR